MNSNSTHPKSGVNQEVTFRSPTARDGAAVWRLARDSRVLDLNSAYCYLMMCKLYSDTCAVAESHGELAGFVTGFRLPEEPESLFIWQIAVAESHRGQGLGLALIQELLSRDGLRDIRYVTATISPSNGPSKGLFAKLAKTVDAPLHRSEEKGILAAWFPEEGHEAEDWFRVGPIQ